MVLRRGKWKLIDQIPMNEDLQIITEVGTDVSHTLRISSGPESKLFLVLIDK